MINKFFHWPTHKKGIGMDNTGGFLRWSKVRIWLDVVTKQKVLIFGGAREQTVPKLVDELESREFLNGNREAGRSMKGIETLLKLLVCCRWFQFQKEKEKDKL